MNLALVAVGAGLSLIGLGGALAPFLRPRPVPTERLSDPLEDEWRGLLRALRELEEERATGALRADDYRTLRTETEARAVRTLRELASREGRDVLDEGLGEIRELGDPPRIAASGRGRRWATVLLVVASVLAGAVPLLSASLRPRDPGTAITGDLGPGASAEAPDPLAFFEERARRHPLDVAARLDLAHRYLDAGRVGDAIDQYLEALRLDPRNAEAHAHMGLLLYLAGSPEDGLAAVQRALSEDSAYPEALYIKGVILLEGLGRERRAAKALQAYLDAAPFGAEREEAQRLLRSIGVD